MLIFQVMIQFAVFPADIRQADHVLQVFFLRDSGKEIWHLPQQLRMEMHGPGAGKNGHIEDLGFHQVLEDMGTVGELRIVARPAFRHLTDRVEPADIREGRRNAELGEEVPIRPGTISRRCFP